MKLYIQQKVFSWNDRFTIYNDQEDTAFSVEGEIFSFGKKLHIYDLMGGEAAYIEQKLFSFLPRYSIYSYGSLIAEIRKEFTFFKPVYTVDGLGWEVVGDFFAHEYEIRLGDTLIANIQKAYLTWGDYYELDILDERNGLGALCVALTIDCVIEQSRS